MNPHSDNTITKRKVLLKLELGGDVPKQLANVATKLYNIDLQHVHAAENNKNWKVIDEVLYSEARKSYDEIINAFESKPKVYKFESTKNKIWERNKFGGRISQNASSESITEIHKNQNDFDINHDENYKNRNEASVPYGETNETSELQLLSEPPLISLDDEVVTYLDPFELNKVISGTNHKHSGSNSTAQLSSQRRSFKNKSQNKSNNKRLHHKIDAESSDNQKSEAPIWTEKMYKLEKLTPREDLEGYEFKEDYYEQQRRIEALDKFQQLMHVEIRRRENYPTEIEQVEDVLYDIVEAVSREYEFIENDERQIKKNKIRSRWHPSSVGFHMHPLGENINKNGVVNRIVSDFDFKDFTVTKTGKILAINAPSNLFEMHAKERRIAAEEELRKLAEEDAELRRPLTQKLRNAVAMARNDGDYATASKKVAKDVMEKALYWPRKVSQRLVQQSRIAIAQGLSGLLRAVSSLSTTPSHAFGDRRISGIEAVSDSVLDSFRSLVNKQSFIGRNKSIRSNSAIEQQPKLSDVEKMIRYEEEKHRQRSLSRAQQQRLAAQRLKESLLPIPVVPPDCVQITITMLLSPPPAYVRKPPATWKREVEIVSKNVYQMAQHVTSQYSKEASRFYDGHFGETNSLCTADAVIVGQSEEIKQPQQHGQPQLHPGIVFNTAATMVKTGITTVVAGIAATVNEISSITRANLTQSNLKAADIREDAEFNHSVDADTNIETQDETHNNFNDLDNFATRIQPLQSSASIAPALTTAQESIKHALTSNSAEVGMGANNIRHSNDQLEGEVDRMHSTVASAVVIADNDNLDSDDSDAHYEAEQDSEEEFDHNDNSDGEIIQTKSNMMTMDNMQIQFNKMRRKLQKKLKILLPSTTKFVPKYTLADEEVCVDAIINKATFAGNIKPEDLIPKAFKDNEEMPGLVNLVFDNSARVAFEKRLIKEIADAASIPVKTISIEEVRRLPIDYPKLYELKQRHSEMIAKLEEEKQIKKDAMAQQRKDRKALNDGTVAKLANLEYENKMLLNGTKQFNGGINVNTDANTGGINANTDGINANTDAVINSPSNNEQQQRDTSISETQTNEAASDIVDNISDDNYNTEHNLNSFNADSQFSKNQISNINTDKSVGLYKAGSALDDDDDEGNGSCMVNDDANQDSRHNIVSSAIPIKFQHLPPHVFHKMIYTATQHTTVSGKETFFGSATDVDIAVDVSKANLLETATSTVNCNSIDNQNDSFSPRGNVLTKSVTFQIQKDQHIDVDDSNLDIVSVALVNDDEDKQDEDNDEGNNDILFYDVPRVNNNNTTSNLNITTVIDKHGCLNSPMPVIDQPKHVPIRYLSSAIADNRLFGLSAEEKRRYRIARLRLLRKEDALKRQIQNIKQTRDDLVEDTIDYFAPMVEQLQKQYKVKIQPTTIKVQAQVVKIALACFATIDELTRDQRQHLYENYYCKYRGPKMVDIVRIHKTLVQVTSACVLSIASTTAAVKKAIEARRAAIQRTREELVQRELWHRRVRAEVQSVLYAICIEVEYCEIEDQVEALLYNMCGTVEQLYLRNEVSSVLSNICDAIEKQTAAELLILEEQKAQAAAQIKAVIEAEQAAIAAEVEQEYQRMLAKQLDSDGTYTADDDDNESAANSNDDNEDSSYDGNGYTGVFNGEDDDSYSYQGSYTGESEGEEEINDDDNEEETEEIDNNSKLLHGSKQSDDDNDDLVEDEEVEMLEDDVDENLKEAKLIQTNITERVAKINQLESQQQEVFNDLNKVEQQLRALDAAADSLKSRPNDINTNFTKENLINLITETEQESNEIVTQTSLNISLLLNEMCNTIEERIGFEAEDKRISFVENKLTGKSVEDDNFTVSEFPDDATAPSIGEITLAEMDLVNRLVGCEITLMIRIDDEQRLLDGLNDIEAEDIAVLLMQQLYDTESPLHDAATHIYTTKIVDIQYKLAHSRRIDYPSRESFWSHVVHPTFFGYSTYKSSASKAEAGRNKNVDNDDFDGGRNRRLIDGRLPSGVVPLYAMNLLNERNKETYQQLLSKPLLRAPGARRIRDADDTDSDSDNEGSVVYASDGGGVHSFGDYAGGKIVRLHAGEHNRKLKLFRPNMKNLTAKDLLHLKRVLNAFEARYEREMKKGLVDGKRLRPEQFTAMKDRDSAYRIYRTAKQKFHHILKKKNITVEEKEHLIGDINSSNNNLTIFEDKDLLLTSQNAATIGLEITKIDHSTFDAWLDEVKKDDLMRRMEIRAITARRKKLQQQESLLRRRANQQRYWLIDKYVALCEHPVDVGHAFHESMLKIEMSNQILSANAEMEASSNRRSTLKSVNGNSSGVGGYSTTKKRGVDENLIVNGKNAKGGSSIDAATERLLSELKQQRVEQKKRVVSEEKITRRLFTAAMGWAVRRKELIEKQRKYILEELFSNAVVPTLTTIIAKDGEIGCNNLNDTESSDQITADADLVDSVAVNAMLTSSSLVKCNDTLSNQCSNQTGGDDGNQMKKQLDKINNGNSTMTEKVNNDSDTEGDSWNGEEKELPSLDKEVLLLFLNAAVRDINEDLRTKKQQAQRIKLELKAVAKARRLQSLQVFFQANSNNAKSLAMNEESSDSSNDENETAEIDEEDAEKSSNIFASRTQSFFCGVSDSRNSNINIFGASSNSLFASNESAMLSNKVEIGASDALNSSQATDDGNIVLQQQSDIALLPSLTQDEMEIVQQAQWIKVLLQQKQFIDCLKELPTLSPNSYARNELVQFAAIICEVAPIFLKVLSDLEAAREAEEIALGYRKPKAVIEQTNFRVAALVAEQRKKEREERKKARKLAKEAAVKTASNNHSNTELEAETVVGVNTSDNKNDFSNLTNDDSLMVVDIATQNIGDNGCNDTLLVITEDEKQRLLDEDELQKQLKALELIRLSAEKEKAWFMAHPHKFVRYPGEAEFFCITCKEKEFEFWWKQQKEAEWNWRSGFASLLSERFAVEEVSIRALTEHSQGSVLMETATEQVRQEMLAEELRQFEKQQKLLLEAKSGKALSRVGTASSNISGGGNAISNFSSSLERIHSPTTNSPITSQHKQMQAPLSPGGGNDNIPGRGTNVVIAGGDGLSIWARELIRIEGVISNKANLCLVDPFGRSILPKKPTKQSVATGVAADGLPVIPGAAPSSSFIEEDIPIPPMVIDDEIDEPEETYNSAISKSSKYQIPRHDMASDNINTTVVVATMGLRIRVWHRDSNGDRANFLGTVTIPEKELLKPSKGERTYPLRTDQAVVESNPIHVTGGLTLLLKMTQTTLKKRKKGEDTVDASSVQTKWKLEIMRGSKLGTIISYDKTSNTTTTTKIGESNNIDVIEALATESDDAVPTTNITIIKPSPYCEVYWKGPSERNGQPDFIHKWALIGHTSVKYNTSDPVYNKDVDGSLFELPPIWTEQGIHRGAHNDHFEEGGGWVARSHVPPAAATNLPGKAIEEETNMSMLQVGTGTESTGQIFIKSVASVALARSGTAGSSPVENGATLTTMNGGGGGGHAAMLMRASTAFSAFSGSGGELTAPGTPSGDNNRDRSSPGNRRLRFGARNPDEILHFRTLVRYNELVTAEVVAILEVSKYLHIAEEMERKCMAREERDLRKVNIVNEVERSRDLVSKQTVFSRAFMQMLHLVQSPPNILARLRFLMGEESKGGGMKILCEDPATAQVVHVVSTPILYPSDEKFMTDQVHSIVALTCENLVKITDFSVHQVRDFNCGGFSSIDERVAITVLDFTEGPTILQYLKKNWYAITNDQFRAILGQIALAMQTLHEAGLVHRNIHPDAVILKLPNAKRVIGRRANTNNNTVKNTANSLINNKNQNIVSSSNKRNSVTRKSTVTVPNTNITCYLGDYWFIHNPREAGCLSSQGRADWGTKMTLPPELKSVFASAEREKSADTIKTNGSSHISAYARINAAASKSAARRNADTETKSKRTKLMEADGVVVDDGGNSTSRNKTNGNYVCREKPILNVKNDNKYNVGVVTDRSDVYAFGVCVYYWATGGIVTLPTAMGVEDIYTSGSGDMIDIAAARRKIPLKWSAWLHSLLEMCLQPRPELRASSKEICTLLNSRVGR